VAQVVKSLRSFSGSAEVRRLSSALIEKWRTETVDCLKRQKRSVKHHFKPSSTQQQQGREVGNGSSSRKQEGGGDDSWSNKIEESD